MRGRGGVIVCGEGPRSGDEGKRATACEACGGWEELKVDAASVKDFKRAGMWTVGREGAVWGRGGVNVVESGFVATKVGSGTGDY